MSEQTVTDLDDLVPVDKKVKFSGRVYTVPGDMPMVTYLKFSKIQSSRGDEDVDEGVLIHELVEAVVELFCWRDKNDDVDREALHSEILRLGLGTVTKIFGAIYRQTEDEAVEEEGDVPPPVETTEAGTTQT